MTKINSLRYVAGAAATALAMAAGGGALAADLPRSMVWSSYDLGSAGHTEATGMANALQSAYKTRIRIVPSGTSIGRMLPMVTGRVNYGFLGNEAFFSSEATFDFAAKQWGPQDIRVLMGRPSPIGMATSRCEERGIKTMADLKGKKIGYVKGNPSVNVKNDAMLAFAGLTRDDVEAVWFGGWGQQLPAILAGQIDVMNNVPTSGQVRHIEASPGGLCGPRMPAAETAGWKRAPAAAGCPPSPKWRRRTSCWTSVPRTRTCPATTSSSPSTPNASLASGAFSRTSTTGSTFRRRGWSRGCTRCPPSRKSPK